MKINKHVIRGGESLSSSRTRAETSSMQRAGDQPFCCASSRCSPPRRRALLRRGAPFSTAGEEKNPPDLFPRISCSFPDVRPSSSSVFLRSSSLSVPLGDPLSSSLCSQKTLHANNRERDVRVGGGDRGAGLAILLRSGTVCENKR